LFVVSTPIGNLGDLSARGVEVLKAVRVIACEDTRVTGKLLNRFHIETPRTSYHEHNEAKKAVDLLDRLERGEDVALVSDAGTPLVSDPGYRLVKAARGAGIEIRAVPGPSAVLAALAVSGLPPSPFTFLGFLPPKGSARRAALGSLARLDHTFVLFEAGTRIGKLLAELRDLLGPRPAALMREMTKLHEEHRMGTLEELARWAEGRSFRGELTLVVSGEPVRASPETEQDPVFRWGPRFRELREQGLTPREAAKAVARESGLPARVVYREMAVAREGCGGGPSQVDRDERPKL
jgi:16S rRNA (cytidine1402-2'-O)-methyltransferase